MNRTTDIATQPYRRGELIHELFADCARESPESTAMVHGEATISYGSLEAAAQRLARRLEDAGVGPGQMVPVVLPRSIPLAVAFLATLKRGAAYAALDPRWPAARISELVGRLGAPVVVTDTAEFACGLPSLVPDLSPVAGRSAGDHSIVVAGDSPASVFFTSGTTGEPKGALSPHRGTVRLFQDCTFAEFDRHTVMPLTSAVPWDALTLELWGVLLNGGVSVVVDEPYLLPSRLRELIRDNGVNSVSFTSSLLNMFVDEDLESFDGLRQVFVGGEKVSPRHLEKLLGRYPRLHVVHCYGPVESTLFASTHRVRLADCRREDGVPLGGPVPNTGLHVWDGVASCGPGQVGELLISGDGLAAGYLCDPVQTADRFVTLTIDSVQRRVYRTGDLVHWSDSGSLQFDGRADRQVKVRGRRIELGGLEASASALTGVAECAAVAVPNDVGGYGAVALVYVSRSTPPLDEQTMLGQLRATLPGHLIPDRVIRVTALPLNDNGKLDAKALLRIAGSQASVPEGSAADQVDELTAAVAGVMAEVLGVPYVASDSDFLSLGGTSLQLGVVCTRLSLLRGVPVPLSEVVGRATADEVVAWLRDADSDRRRADPPEESATSDVVPLVGMQESFFMRQAIFPSDITGLCPLAWRMVGTVDHDALAAALDDVQHRHEALRSAYLLDEGDDGHPIAVVRTERGRCDFEVRAASTAEDADRLLRESLMLPLQIEDGEIWRAALVRVGDSDECLFGIVVHHIAFDGRSEHILARDLSAAYRARAGGRVPRFDSAAPTMAETSALLRRSRAYTATGDHARHQRAVLAGVPEIEFPRPEASASAKAPGTSCVPATATFSVEGTSLDRLRTLARSGGVTDFVALLAAFIASVKSVVGQEDFGIGIPVSLRDGAGLTDAVGCLINVVCLRPSGDDRSPSPERVRALLQDGLKSLSLPFTEVVRMVNPPRSARDPLFQLMLVYQDSERGLLDLDGCAVEPWRVPSVQATSEVVVELWPIADGSLTVDITYQEDRVAESFPPALAAAFARAVEDGHMSRDAVPRGSDL